MVKEYLFKVTKEQYITVSATNKEDAYELAEENSLIDTRDEEVVDVELVDVYEEDIDAICDDYRLGMYVSRGIPNSLSEPSCTFSPF